MAQDGPRILMMFPFPDPANIEPSGCQCYKGGEAGSQTVRIRKQTKQTAGRINIETTPAGAGVFTRNRGNQLASRIGTVDCSPGNLVDWHSWMLNIRRLSMNDRVLRNLVLICHMNVIECGQTIWE